MAEETTIGMAGRLNNGGSNEWWTEVERYVATCSLDIGQVMRANRSGPWVQVGDYKALEQRVGGWRQRALNAEARSITDAGRATKAETERDELLALIQRAVKEFRDRASRADNAAARDLRGWFAGNAYGLGEAIAYLQSTTSARTGET